MLTPRIDDDVVVLARGRAPDDEAHRAGAFTIDQHLTRLTTVASATCGVGDGDAGDVEIRDRTVERPAVRDTF